MRKIINKCDKCDNESIFLIKKSKFDWDKELISSLCINHAPKLSNGESAYKELTIIVALNEPEPIKLSTPNMTNCHVCNKDVNNLLEFIHQKIINGRIYSTNNFELEIGYAFPIEEIEYYVCKEGFGCAYYEKR